MHKIWKKTLNKLSGNLTTNEYMPKRIKNALLEDDENLNSRFILKEIKFPKLKGGINKIQGFNILAGLQNFEKKDYLTVFRAVRFPTNKRMFETIYNKGCTMPNLEQERILELYKDKEYIKKRKNIQENRNFWVQPQERVVKGLPVFRLVNDAIQIHHAFRHKIDKVLVIVMYIPFKLLKSKKIKLIANSAIDLDYKNNERDFEITDYTAKDSKIKIDLMSLSIQGIDLHEMYIKNLPCNMKGCEKYGVLQNYFLLDIYKIKKNDEIKKLHRDTKTLMQNNYFLHGFFGDQNIFARRASKYLPYKCYTIKQRKN